jgi:glycine betaine/choline ABC-type transport system substrate-binding protein
LIFFKNKGLSDVISSLDGIHDDKTMQRLNFQVDGKGLSPSEAAGTFLISKGLLDMIN